MSERRWLPTWGDDGLTKREVLAEIGVDAVRDWLEDQGYCVMLEWPTDE